MTINTLSCNVKYFALAGAILAHALLCAANDERPGARAEVERQGLYLKVRVDPSFKIAKAKSGEQVEGTLARDVYSAASKRFSAGDRVRVLVDHVEKRRRPRNDHWPWLVNAFTPRYQSYPVFRMAEVTETGSRVELQASLLSYSRKHEVNAQAKKHSAEKVNGFVGLEKLKPRAAKGEDPIMVLEAFEQISSGSSSERKESVVTDQVSSNNVPSQLPAGTRCKIILLSDLSASKSRPGDAIQARLLEPVMLGSRVVLPSGSLLEGRVLRERPPRWGSRSGSLAITFTQLTLPDGAGLPIATSVVSAELDRGSHTRIDAEGQLHGARPGRAWMAINMGVTAGLAKEADDATQLIIEVIVETATDASTAGAARIASSCVSGIYMVSRHGRDVILPRFTEMDLAFDRPVLVNETAANSARPATPAKN